MVGLHGLRRAFPTSVIPWFYNSTSALGWLCVKHQSWNILGGNSRNSAFTTSLGCHLGCSGAISHPWLQGKLHSHTKLQKPMKFTQIWVQQWYQDYFSVVSPSQGSLVPAGVYKHNSTSIIAALTLHLPITSLAVDPTANSEPQEQPNPCKEWNSSGETSVGKFPKQKGKFPSVSAENISVSLLCVPRSPFGSNSRAGNSHFPWCPGNFTGSHLILGIQWMNL